MRKPLILILLIFGVLPYNAYSDEWEHWVSLFHLIANPEVYDNKIVRVTGYFVQESQIGYRLYPYEIDAKIGDITRGVQVVSLTETENQDFSHCTDTFAKLVGTFAVSDEYDKRLVIHSVQHISIYDESEKYTNFSGCFDALDN